MVSQKSPNSLSSALLGRWPLFLLPAVSMPTLVTWYDSFLGFIRGMVLVLCLLLVQHQIHARRQHREGSSEANPWPWFAMFSLTLFMMIVALTGGMFLVSLLAVSVIGSWLRFGAPDWQSKRWGTILAGVMTYAPLTGFSGYETTTMPYTAMIAGVFISSYVQRALLRAWIDKAEARSKGVAVLLGGLGLMVGMSDISILRDYAYLAVMTFPLWTLIPWALMKGNQPDKKLVRLGRLQFWSLFLNGLMLVFVTRHWPLFVWAYHVIQSMQTKG